MRLALHPDDPPVPEPLGGVAQICSTLEQFRRIFFEIAPSQSNCMLFCQGCMTELLGPEKVYDAIAEAASEDKIAWVHFRNVRGQLPRFTEVFIDEGEVDMRRAMEVYRDKRVWGALHDGPHAVLWEGVRGAAWEGVCDRVYPGVGGGGVWVTSYDMTLR